MATLPDATLPSPKLYDRSLKTVDIKGAYPQRLMLRQEVFENRSLVTSDIKGAQPKITIRTLNHPQYDPSARIDNFSSTNFQRSPDINTGNFSSHPTARITSVNIPQSVQVESVKQPTNVELAKTIQSPTSILKKVPYHPIAAYDREKISFYNGPVTDRIRRPYNQPQSQISAENVLGSAVYHQQDVSQLQSINKTISSQNGQLKSPQMINRPASKNIFQNVDEFKNNAPLRVTRSETPQQPHQQQQLQQQENIQTRIISPKQMDLQEKMTNYQKQKDVMMRQVMSKSATSHNLFKPISSNGNNNNSQQIPKVMYNPTPIQEHVNQELQLKQRNLNSQSMMLQRAPSAQIQTQAKVQDKELPHPFSLRHGLSPKHLLLERNIFSKPLSAQNKFTYLKPYTVNPKVDITTEYTTKFNQSPIEQLRMSVTPTLKRESVQVPWSNKQQSYNLIGNYVQDNRNNALFDNGRVVEKYYKQYNGDDIFSMRKGIHEAGNSVPYEVKFKYEKTKDNYYSINSVPRVQESPLAFSVNQRSHLSGHSDLFQTQHYAVKDPINANKFIYAEKPKKNIHLL